MTHHRTNRAGRLALLTSLLAFALCQGCAGAQHVRRGDTGGELSLRGPFMFAMGEARTKMAEHCGGPFLSEQTGDGLRYRCITAR